MKFRFGTLIMYCLYNSLLAWKYKISVSSGAYQGSYGIAYAYKISACIYLLFRKQDGLLCAYFKQIFYEIGPVKNINHYFAYSHKIS